MNAKWICGCLIGILLIGLITILAINRTGITSAKANDPEDNSLFGGAELTMLATQTGGQMMSFGIKTKEGNLIIIDGGRRADAAHLAQYIHDNGGKVTAWFLTHAHDDHSGALAEMIENKELIVEIEKIYYAFPPDELVEHFEPQHYSHQVDINGALEQIDAERKYLLVDRGEEFQFDEIVVKVMNDGSIFYTDDVMNNGSLVFRIEIGRKRMMFLGDLGVSGARRLLKDYAYDDSELKCDLVQMSHHGQAHLEREVYEKINPDICLWPTPLWLWNNDSGSGKNSGDWSTLITRQWMEELGVGVHYVSFDNDITLR